MLLSVKLQLNLWQAYAAKWTKHRCLNRLVRRAAYTGMLVIVFSVLIFSLFSFSNLPVGSSKWSPFDSTCRAERLEKPSKKCTPLRTVLLMNESFVWCSFANLPFHVYCYCSGKSLCELWTHPPMFSRNKQERSRSVDDAVGEKWRLRHDVTPS